MIQIANGESGLSVREKLNTFLPQQDNTLDQELTFDSCKIMASNNRHVQTGNLSFTVGISGNEIGAYRLYYIQADGMNTFTFSSDFESFPTNDIANAGVGILDTTYLFSFLYLGDKVLYSIKATDAAPVDVTAPTLSTQVIENATPSALNLTFDEAVTITTAGWSIATDGAALSILAVEGGSGTTTPTFTLSRDLTNGETVTISYDSATGNTLDLAGNELADITNRSVTNNVTDTEDIVWTSASAEAIISGNDITATAGAYDAYAIATKKIAAGDDGSFQCEITTNPMGAIIGFNTSQVSEKYTGYEYGIGIMITGNYQRIVSGTPTDLGIAHAVDDLYRLVRTSGTIKIQYDRGAGWVDLYTFGTYTGDLFLNGNARDASNDGVRNAIGENLSTI